MENIQYRYDEEELARVKLDFDALATWRNVECDDLPVCSFLSVYEASGLRSYVEQYSLSNNNTQIVAADNLKCNFYTLQRLKNFITNNWQIYSIDIAEDNHVFWDTKRWRKNEAHYARTLRAKVRNSINMDCINYCPGIDDDLEDNVIVFKIYHKVAINPEDAYGEGLNEV